MLEEEQLTILTQLSQNLTQMSKNLKDTYTCYLAEQKWLAEFRFCSHQTKRNSFLFNSSH